MSPTLFDSTWRPCRRIRDNWNSLASVFGTYNSTLTKPRLMQFALRYSF